MWYIIIFLIAMLSSRLGDMKFPVRIYGIVISFMVMLAMHMSFIGNKKAGWLMLLGALLFVISDSVLAVNKFYQAFKMGGIVIMFTYGLAQLFIIQGAIDYISSAYKE
ncbi:MAG TPA: lysoplasmalogenase [Chitinophagaceae bacterium]|nr:lysoplasmalogenase [Chitinophagaceae bacterium]